MEGYEFGILINMNTRKIEKLTKGIANHRRVQIMDLLDRTPNLSVIAVADELNVNFKTISEHLRRLTFAELVMKRNMGNEVQHALSPRGKYTLKFLRTLE